MTTTQDVQLRKPGRAKGRPIPAIISIAGSMKKVVALYLAHRGLETLPNLRNGGVDAGLDGPLWGQRCLRRRTRRSGP